MDKRNTSNPFPTINTVKQAPKVILFHEDCPDGFGSAFCAWLKFKDAAEYIPCKHGNAPPNCDGKDVAVFDFSWNIDYINQIKKQSSSFILFDHHASAFKELKNEADCYFDLNKSGATLAWEFFFPDTPTPLLIQYVEDRDLWRWAVPDTKEFNIAIESVPFDFKEWEKLLDKDEVDRRIVLGKNLLAYKESIIDGICKYAVLRKWEGFNTYVVNCGVFVSEVGNTLSSKPECDVAFMYEYSIEENKWRISLRSSRDDVDVSVLAKKYGGGGHPRASGMAWPGSDITTLLTNDQNSANNNNNQ